MNYMTEIREFVVENFLFGDASRLKDDSSFLRQNIIDSTGILEFVSFLESNYDIQIEDDELVPENFDSLNAVAAFLQRKIMVA